MSTHPIPDTVSLEKKSMKPVGGFKSLDQVAEFLVWQAKDSVSQAILHMSEKLQVRNLETGEIVHTVHVKGHSERNIEKIIMGMLRNMNRDKYVIDEV